MSEETDPLGLPVREDKCTPIVGTSPQFVNSRFQPISTANAGDLVYCRVIVEQDACDASDLAPAFEAQWDVSAGPAPVGSPSIPVDTSITVNVTEASTCGEVHLHFAQDVDLQQTELGEQLVVRQSRLTTLYIRQGRNIYFPVQTALFVQFPTVLISVVRKRNGQTIRGRVVISSTP